MGSQVTVQIIQFEGGEYPNERAMNRLESFPLEKKISEKELKEYIRLNYGYCPCKQIVYSKEASSIEKKYPVPNLKGTRIYVSISHETNCRCAFLAIEEFRFEVMNEIKLLHKENEELKNLIKEKNDNIVKLNKTVKELQSQVNEMKKENSTYFRSKTQV